MSKPIYLYGYDCIANLRKWQSEGPGRHWSIEANSEFVWFLCRLVWRSLDNKKYSTVMAAHWPEEATHLALESFAKFEKEERSTPHVEDGPRAGS